MQIGQISRQTGLSIDSIRFYERSRLIRVPPRSEGGFRLYSSADVSALQFIRNLQTPRDESVCSSSGCEIPSWFASIHKRNTG